MKGIEPHIRRFIDTLVTDPTKTISKLAEEFDVSEATISNWKREYRDEIQALSIDIAQNVRNNLIQLGTKAVMTVNELMDDENGSVRLGASRAVLDKIISDKQDITSGVPFVLNIVKEGESKSPSGEG